jgi:hypothetical protein
VAPFAEADERRHRPGAEPWWEESWYFDLAAPDASVGGFVRLGLYPNQGLAWYWAALVGHDRRLVLVRDHEVELPRGRDLEIRSQGLWSALNCETPLDHWSVGLEAFAVALDDPAEAYRGERGDSVGLGFDLEWEAMGPTFGPLAPVVPAGYGQACRVSGEILVGEERLGFDGVGHRAHTWGPRQWWSTTGAAAAGVMADGATFAVCAVGGAPPAGFLASAAAPADGDRPEPVERHGVAIEATRDAAGLPVSAVVEVGPLTLAAAVVAPAPLLVEAGDTRRARLASALCLYRARDGRQGVGWAQWLTPG